jgi:putative transposase
VVEIESSIVEPLNQSVGIDLGLKTFAVLSTGEKFKSPNYSKQKKIRKLQRKLAR